MFWTGFLAALVLSVSVAPMLGSMFKDCPNCADMVVIPAGSFLMGVGDSDMMADQDEEPQHSVTLESFALGKYEVTQEQWLAVMGRNPSSNKGQTLPVESVSWEDI